MKVFNILRNARNILSVFMVGCIRNYLDFTLKVKRGVDPSCIYISHKLSGITCVDCFFILILMMVLNEIRVHHFFRRFIT